MGRLRRSRAHHARRDVHRAARTRVRTKDLDQIQDDMKPENKGSFEAQPLDEDKPGLGQHYCIQCAKYCETTEALRTHMKSKVHKRRVRDLKDPAYTVKEAEKAAGMGSADNKQRGVEEVVKRFEGLEGMAGGNTEEVKA